MKVLRYRRFGLWIQEIWFNQLKTIDADSVDVVQFRESYESLDEILVPFKNGVISLTQSLLEIQSNFDKGFRYELKRAEREKIVVEELFKVTALDEIVLTYEKFCQGKAITPIPRRFLDMYFKNGYLKIWSAMQNGLVLQYHFYFLADEECILLASFPGENATFMKNAMIGYANRYLHYKVIEDMSKRGKVTYNLGGIGNSNDERTKGIVRFKMEMSPQTKTYFNGIVGVSFLGRFYVLLLKFFK